MKNKLIDLNNHLFTQLERLNDDELKGEALVDELKRAKAMTEVGKVIVSNAQVTINAAKLIGGGDEENIIENLLPSKI